MCLVRRELFVVEIKFTFRTLTEMAEKKRVRYEEVEQAGASITSLVRDCQKYFQASDGSESWRKYLSFLDAVVVDGLLKQCASSLGYLIGKHMIDHMDIRTMIIWSFWEWIASILNLFWIGLL